MCESAPIGKPRYIPPSTTLGCLRTSFGNRFVYAVVSARARGLSLGINMNPDRLCNFKCVYCEVRHDSPPADFVLDVRVMVSELEQMLSLVRSGKIREHPAYAGMSNELLQLRHVALSGDGEPTLCPSFGEALQAIIHVRAAQPNSFFKLALITNGTGLDSPVVQENLRYFINDDEVWIKLDAGTQAYMDIVNRGDASLTKVLANIVLVGRLRPVVIQSLFPVVDGLEPPESEISQYILRLQELKNAGARISLIQIYSATRPIAYHDCGHLSLKSLSRIRQRIKIETGLRAEIF